MDGGTAFLLWMVLAIFVGLPALVKLPNIIAFLRDVDLPSGCSVHDPTGLSHIPEWFLALWYALTLKGRRNDEPAGAEGKTDPGR